MTYLFYLAYNIQPIVSEELLKQYRYLRESQLLNIKQSATRQLSLCLAEPENILAVMQLLTMLGKHPKILAAMDVDGNDLKREDGSVVYPRDFIEMDAFLSVPVTYQDIDGNTLQRFLTYSELPTYAGYKSFDFEHLS